MFDFWVVFFPCFRRFKLGSPPLSLRREYSVTTNKSAAKTEAPNIKPATMGFLLVKVKPTKKLKEMQYIAGLLRSFTALNVPAPSFFVPSFFARLPLAALDFKIFPSLFLPFAVAYSLAVNFRRPTNGSITRARIRVSAPFRSKTY